ncbi:MAG TPA: hypothetical protein ENK44_12435 [Caldithrix abyssi]|uniref:Transglutaminase domain-containing protein n=1 Tax=Caldithrix abyssi TaxID=187145 RepID=A0A7V4WW37_CALAY|nr:hypothetical protein [Caldithrix abyssi]
MNTNLLLLLGSFFIITSSVFAQDTYEEWLKKDRAQFNTFLSDDDKAFLDFLKKDWQEFLTSQGIKPDTKPKPVRMPEAKPQDKPAPPPDALKKVEPLALPAKKPVPPPPPKPLIPKPKQNILVPYFGRTVPFQKAGGVALKLQTPISSEQVSKAWEQLASSEAAQYVSQLQAYKKQMKLNDWGYVVLVHNLSKTVMPGGESHQNLFSWFLLLKSGYKAKVAYKDNAVFLLLPNENLIYENQFVTLDNRKYYFVSFGKTLDLSGKVYSYQGAYPNAKTIPNMKLTAVPVIKNETGKKQLHFVYQGKRYDITVRYDKDIIDLFKKYPQTELKVYFDAPVSPSASYSLLTALAPAVQGKSELEAVNFLLRFVQTAFEYKTDDQQFGREKYLMPEETLYYPASDCEDRSILFAFLVKNLLGMDIIALDYPGHIATAVKFRSNINGDSVQYNGSRYVICDPTYINADAGMAMPEFKTVTPVVIPL